MKINENGVYREMTSEEEKERAELMEQMRERNSGPTQEARIIGLEKQLYIIKKLLGLDV